MHSAFGELQFFVVDMQFLSIKNEEQIWIGHAGIGQEGDEIFFNISTRYMCFFKRDQMVK